MDWVEIRLGWAHLRRRPVAALAQAAGLAFAVAIGLLAFAFWRVLHSDVAIPGANCTQGVGLLSMQMADGSSLERFSSAQVRALRQSLSLPLIPVLSTVAEVQAKGRTALSVGVEAIDPALFPQMCVAVGQGRAFVGEEPAAVVAGDIAAAGSTLRIGVQAFPVVASGTPFRGLTPDSYPTRVFIPLRYAASSGVDPDTVGMPVLRVLVGKARPGEAIGSELEAALAEHRDLFPGVTRLRKLPGLALGGSEVDSLDRDAQLFAIAGGMLVVLAWLNILAYQIGRQGDAGWRMKILRDLGAKPRALRAYAAVEPVLLAATAIAMGAAISALVLPTLAGQLDLGRLAAKLYPHALDVVGMVLLLALPIAAMAELRYRMAMHVLPRVVRRWVLGGFNYVIALQGLACVIALGLAAQMAWGYWRAKPSHLGYDMRDVVTYQVSPASGTATIPRDFRARIQPILATLGQSVHGAAALSQNFLPINGFGWSTMSVIQPRGAHVIYANNVTPGFFAVLRMPLAAGQVFGYGDLPAKDPDPNAWSGEGRVAIANTLATKELRLEPAVGAVVMGRSDASISSARYAAGADKIDDGRIGTVPIRIVGVVNEGASGSLRADRALYSALYLPFLTPSNMRNEFVLWIRHAPGMPQAQVDAAARRAVGELELGAVPDRGKPLQRVFDEATARERSIAWLFGALAAGALALAWSGLLAVGALRANMQRLQHAVHFSLGATRRQRAAQHAMTMGVPMGAGLLLGGCVLWMVLSMLADTLHLTAMDAIWTCVATVVATAVMAAVTLLLDARSLIRADYAQWLKTE